MSHNRISILASVIAIVALAAPASAQLNGANILGDTGVDSASQPPPGFWLGGLYYQYRTDTIRRADGSRLTTNAGDPATLSIPAFSPTLQYVAPGTFLGGHYGAFFAPGLTTASLQAPGFGLDRQTSVGVADTYIVPLQLGWHLPQADLITAIGVWAPTGRYSAGASDNTGRGMWTYEASGGATLFLDPGRTISLATTAYYETHGRKEGTALNLGPSGQIALGGVRVGDIVSLEGGFAREFLNGTAHIGAAYYAQWKLTADDFGMPVAAPDGTPLSRHRVFGVGPDVALPIGTKSLLIGVVNVRYFWETGAEVKTEGQALFVTMSFALPSLKVE